MKKFWLMMLIVSISICCETPAQGQATARAAVQAARLVKHRKEFKIIEAPDPYAEPDCAPFQLSGKITRVWSDGKRSLAIEVNGKQLQLGPRQVLRTGQAVRVSGKECGGDFHVQSCRLIHTRRTRR